MSYNLRTRRVAYDNISSTGAGGGTGVTGRERTILGNAGSTEKYNGGSRIKAGSDGATSPQEASTEPTTNFARNRMLTTTGGVTSLDPREYPAI